MSTTLPINTQEEYNVVLGMVAQAAAVLAIVPIDQMLDMVRKAESIGPFCDPTAFVRPGNNTFARLAAQRRLLEAAAKFLTAAKLAAPELVEAAI